jgi:hypothetical protein
MRIDIGAGGKIIGTRRVSPNGQVSGLSEFSGQEVLVILPGGAESETAPPWASPEAVARVVEGQVRQAYQQYELLRELYGSPWEATQSFVRSAFGSSWPDLSAEVERWVKDQLRTPGAGRAASSDSSQPKGKGTGQAERRPTSERRGRGASQES